VWGQDRRHRSLAEEEHWGLDTGWELQVTMSTEDESSKALREDSRPSSWQEIRALGRLAGCLHPSLAGPGQCLSFSILCVLDLSREAFKWGTLGSRNPVGVWSAYFRRQQWRQEAPILLYMKITIKLGVGSGELQWVEITINNLKSTNLPKYPSDRHLGGGERKRKSVDLKSM
jgi:hypothetical protein